MLDQPTTPKPTAEQEPWTPSLDDQLRVMKEHFTATGKADMPEPISRAENLLRRALTATQVKALPLVFPPEPTEQERAEGLLSAVGLEYNSEHWSILPLIRDLKWDPKQVIETLKITPPAKALKLDAEPITLFNIFHHGQQGPVLVHDDIPAPALYNKILAVLLPYYQEKA